MIFSEMAAAEAEGAILAHSVRMSGATFKKGRTLSASDVDALAAAGITRVTAVRLEASDVPEDHAAAELASALAGTSLRTGEPFTGRANLFAEARRRTDL